MKNNNSANKQKTYIKIYYILKLNLKSFAIKIKKFITL